VRCHLGVDPQERTAEEHTTRGPHTTLAIFGRETLGGTVSRVWSLWIVRCEGGTCLARTSTTNASRKRSSTNFSPEWTADGELNCFAVKFGSRAGVVRRSEPTRLLSANDDELGGY
jgi:hypothetical protein